MCKKQKSFKESDVLFGRNCFWKILTESKVLKIKLLGVANFNPLKEGRLISGIIYKYLLLWKVFVLRMNAIAIMAA